MPVFKPLCYVTFTHKLDKYNNLLQVCQIVIIQIMNQMMGYLLTLYKVDI